MLYLQLLANDIRLISIQPSEDPGAQVICSLNHFDIGDGFLRPEYAGRSRIQHRKDPDEWVFINHPQKATAVSEMPDFRYIWGDYVALSYTWGDPAITRNIVVNGHTMPVTENLEAALRTLRSKPYIKAGWKIWIDALCIHQKDIVERATQVKRMRDIYGRSMTPIVWLGASSPDSEQAIDLIEKLAGDNQLLDPSYLSALLQQNSKIFGEGVWRALHDFMLRRFWSRAWILQEISLGKADMPVLCGEHTLRWQDIHSVSKTLNKSDEIIRKYMRDEVLDVGRELDTKVWETFGVVEVIEVMKGEMRTEDSINLFRIMYLSRLVDVTDPRDKVYGLLALMDQELTRQIKPDYGATIERVYTDFAKLSIQITKSLDICRHVGVPGPTALPSWVPDWMSPRRLGSLGDIPHRASGNATAQVRYPFPDILSCRGFVFDTFDGMGCVWKDEHGNGWTKSTVIQTTGTSNAYGDRAAMCEALWKSLVANRNYLVETLTDDYGALLAVPALHAAQGQLPNEDLEMIATSHLLQYCMGFYAGNADFLIAGRLLSHYFNDNPDFTVMDPSVLRDALVARDRINLSRRLFTTSKGFVGMTNQDTKATDKICVLFGCSTPVVLREVQDARYVLVGECYVHGLMEGEGLEMVEEGRVEVGVFEIL